MEWTCFAESSYFVCFENVTIRNRTMDRIILVQFDVKFFNYVDLEPLDKDLIDNQGPVLSEERNR